MHTLLYDYSQKKIMKKKKRKTQIVLLGLLTLLMFGCVYISMAPVFGKVRPEARGLEWFFISIAIGYMIFALYEAIRVLGLRDVKVYDTGIITPWRPFHYVLKGKEDLIPFDKIKAVYPNMQQNLDYIIIEFADKNYYKMEALKIDKKWIYDLDEFINVLRGRVKIIEDIDYILVRK